MPLHRRSEIINNKRNYYYQWGESGKKYYFINGSTRSENIAKEKSMKQARAIEWRKHGGFNIDDWFNYLSK